jgi:iron complex outermembrane recepter protein
MNNFQPSSSTILAGGCNRRMIAIAVSAAITAASQISIAQTTPPADVVPTKPLAQKVERIEVTGSSIKRIDGETSLPVQIIKKEDIERTGATTAAELLTKISASAAALTDGASFSDIAGQRGFSGANLRGIGVSSTLILLNGRRVANFASPGGASGVDLNAIPSAAIARVEVLKDGASAIYGTDAIGGVINFITNTDYQGFDASAYTSNTQHGGAGKNIYTVSGGIGSLSREGFNIFGVIDYSENKTLRSGQRKWIGSVYQPDINLDVGSSNTYPANARRTRASGAATGSRLNPAAPACNPPATIYAPGSFVGATACLYDYMQDTEIFPASERLSAMTRAQYVINADHTLFGEYLYSSTNSTYKISPLTVTNLNYPANGKYYPTSLNVTGPLRLNLRLAEAGGRTNEVEAITERLVFGSKGTIAGWDYDAGVNISQSRVVDAYVNGYVATAPFDSAFLTGNINPFGPSDAAGLALLNSTKISDKARDSKGKTEMVDIKASRPLFDLAGGDASLALGLEVRRESLTFTPSSLLAAGQIRGDGAAVGFTGKRDVNAAYAEMNLPFTKALEGQVAIRYDDYSDAGSSTNPKFGLRYVLNKQVLFRTSYSTGFRAPSLADLYAPSRTGQTNGIYNDPLGCIKVGAIDNTNNPDYCGIQPSKLTGGNADLKPEKSKQFSIGTAFEPNNMFSGTFDYWQIEKTDVISAPEGVLFTNPARFAQFFNRAPTDPTLGGIPGFINSIDSRLRNFAALKTTGFDISADIRLPKSELGKFGVNLNGTYVLTYKTQAGAGAQFTDGVGVFVNDQIVQRWRHTLAFNFDRGPFAATLTQTFYKGYKDQNPLQDGSIRNVENYQLWDLTGSYRFTPNFRIRAGVKNVADANPPKSNQVYFFLAGYDPSYTDPRGRTFFASANYSFK